MAIGVITNESSLALKAEVTEGTYVAPTAATDYIEVLSDGLELNKTREELTRDVLSGTVEQEASRVGVAEVSGSIPVELKASATAGDAPQSIDLLMQSLMGGKRQLTGAVTTGSGHSSTVINIASTTGLNVGDMVLVKESGAYEVRPISVVTTDTSITFPFALENGAPSDSVEIEEFTTYYSNTTAAPTLSAEHNLGNAAIKQKVSGLRVVSGAVENWSVGQLPSMNFGVQGLDIVREDADASYAPNFTADGLPPVTLEACVWLGGVKTSYTELAINIENEVSTISDACAASGKIGSRITSQTTTLSVNPYLDDSDLTKTWDVFNDNSSVSVFGYAYNSTATAGEFGEVVCFWLPQCKVTATPVADSDGVVSEAMELKAFRSAGSDSVFIGMI